jgi:hypothetical protein
LLYGGTIRQKEEENRTGHNDQKIKRSKSWKPSFKKKKKDVSWGCVMPIDLGGKDVSKREQQKTIKKERHWYCMGPHKSAWRARCGVACLVSITAFLNTYIILFSITKKKKKGFTSEEWLLSSGGAHMSLISEHKLFQSSRILDVVEHWWVNTE